MKPNKVVEILTGILAGPQVTAVPPPAAPQTAHEIMQAVRNSPDVAMVPVKSAWTSKLNWKSGVALAAAFLAIFGIEVTPQEQAAILAGIIAISEVASVIIRTWFTTSVTAASAGKT